jgi:transposase
MPTPLLPRNEAALTTETLDIDDETVASDLRYRLVFSRSEGADTSGRGFASITTKPPLNTAQNFLAPRPNDESETRRLYAMELLAHGWSQKEIADHLEVTPGAVSQWVRRLRDEGRDGLRSRRHRAGVKPRLTEADWDFVASLLRDSPQTHGFARLTWNCADVARLIHRTFGVQYHSSHIGRVLKARGLMPCIEVVFASGEELPAFKHQNEP